MSPRVASGRLHPGAQLHRRGRQAAPRQPSSRVTARKWNRIPSVKRGCVFFPGGGHLPLAPAVDDPHLFHPGALQRGARRIHGRVTRAHDHHRAAEARASRVPCGTGAGSDSASRAAGMPISLSASAPDAGEHVAESLGLQLRHGCGTPGRNGTAPRSRAAVDVLLHGVLRDAERRQEVAHDPARLLLPLEDVRLEPFPRTGRTRRPGPRGPAPTTAAFMPRWPAIAAAGVPRGAECRRSPSPPRCASSPGCCTDAFPVHARTVARALVVAEIPGHERQGVAPIDRLEGLLERAFTGQVHVLGHVLVDGAGRHAGSDEAIEQRKRPVNVDLARCPRNSLRG